jgi:glycosyltransferase involved in cell wall biosynthesis
MPSPQVSVKMATRNHRAFVGAAIESVLEQRTDFPFDLVVCDDASTDGTAEIARDYERRHPDRVRLLPARPHLGMKATFHRLWDACRGEFVANLDGDDYWTSPDKLQLQWNFMQTHPACVLSFHNVEKVDILGRPLHLAINACPEVVGVASLIGVCFIPSAGAMVRRASVHPLPAGFDDVPMSDWPLYVTLASRGEVRYLDAVLGAWRLHPGGSWTRGGGMSRDDQLHRAGWMIKFYAWALGFANPVHAQLIRAQLSRLEAAVRSLQA